MHTLHPARRLWHALEPIHAVTYFAPDFRDTARGVGLKGFWMGYFAFRAAPLGAVGPAVVSALFAGFRPSMVDRALPDAWSAADPATCLDTRAAASAAALREVGVGDGCGAVADRLVAVVDGLDPTGRPLAAANAALPLPDDPVARLWQVATTLREHRGDGHVAALVAHGLSGLDAHLLQVEGAGEERAEQLRQARGWTEEEWAGAATALAARGIDAGVLASVEAATDLAAWSGGLAGLGEDGVDEVVAALADATDAAAELLPSPNPIGLPGR